MGAGALLTRGLPPYPVVPDRDDLSPRDGLIFGSLALRAFGLAAGFYRTILTAMLAIGMAPAA